MSLAVTKNGSRGFVRNPYFLVNFVLMYFLGACQFSLAREADRVHTVRTSFLTASEMVWRVVRSQYEVKLMN